MSHQNTAGNHSFLCTVPFTKNPPPRFLAGEIYLSQSEGLAGGVGCDLLCPRSEGDLKRAVGVLNREGVGEAWLGIRHVLSKS